MDIITDAVLDEMERKGWLEDYMKKLPIEDLPRFINYKNEMVNQIIINRFKEGI